MNPDWRDERKLLARRRYNFWRCKHEDVECFRVVGDGQGSLKNGAIVEIVRLEEEGMLFVKDILTGRSFRVYYTRLQPLNAMEVLAYVA